MSLGVQSQPGQHTKTLFQSGDVGSSGLGTQLSGRLHASALPLNYIHSPAKMPSDQKGTAIDVPRGLGNSLPEGSLASPPSQGYRHPQSLSWALETLWVPTEFKDL